MKFYSIILVLLGSIAHADMASDLLAASDRGRGDIKEGISWESKIESVEDGESSIRQFEIKAKDHDAYVEATQPARNKGEIYIFNDRNMWFFKPSLKKPVSISSRQKLTGQAANGDIASTHYARDYNAKLERTEMLNGARTYVLMLTAKGEDMTYDKIRYWIDEKTKLAVKAEFLTLQGQPFKIGVMEYENKLQVKKKTTPFISKLTITDAKFPKNKSIIMYSKPKTEDIPVSLFNVNNLSR